MYFFVIYSMCMYMYHCLIQPYSCKIPINDYYTNPEAP